MAPYLIVIKKLSYEESYKIIYEWLMKCDSVRKLDFDPKYLINNNLKVTGKKQIPPMSIYTLETKYRNLYLLLDQNNNNDSNLRLSNQSTGIIEEKNSSIVIATHSPDFLLGCLETNKDITIIRLNYSNNIGTANYLNAFDLEQLVNDPLLRSSDSLSSLFYESAVITESEKDKVFYNEINNKLLLENRGLRNTIFLIAHGKYEIHRLILPLRKLGVPVAAIYDLDVIRAKDKKDIKKVKEMWQGIYSAINIDSVFANKLENQRLMIEDEIKKSKMDVKKFKDTFPEIILDFINILKVYGIFIIPIGELENWSNIAKKGGWLRDALNWISNQSVNNEGIWNFLDEIKQWYNNTDRSGMTSQKRNFV